MAAWQGPAVDDYMEARPAAPETSAVDEPFAPRLWLRITLLVLIFVTVRFLVTSVRPEPLFNPVIAAAFGYNVVVGLAGHKLRLMPAFVLAADLLFVVFLCSLSGGSGSAVKYFGLAYFYLMSPNISENRMKAALLAYTAVVTLMALLPSHAAMLRPAGDKARFALIDIFVLNSAGWPSVLLSGYIERLRRLRKATMLTFHSLYGSLQLRTENLQTALDALTETNERLKETDETKTRLLSNVSHELRTPLASIRSYAEILLNYDDIEKDTEREFLGIILEESRRLTLLVDDVLGMIKLEAGSAEMHAASVDMSEVADDSVRLMEPMAAEKGLYLRFGERGEGPFIVKGNKYQLKQVMVNLLNNALKFTEEGGVEVWVEKDDTHVTVGVRDTGEGLYPDEKDEVFREFYRVADGVEGRPSGSGLGLRISKKIVELHGGRIWVDSTLGEGSAFMFTVPLDLAGVMSGAPSYLPRPRAAAVEPGRDPVVLVAESSRPLRELLRKRIESRGFRTLGASDGRSALKAAVDNEPAAIVSCLAAYGGRDTDLQTGLRNSGRGSRIPIALTSLIIGPDSRLQVAVNGFVSRPVDRFELTRLAEVFAPRGRGAVLLVSPDREEARNIQVVLGNRGYRVVVADPSQAAGICRSERPKLAIIDAMLPDEGYREVLAALRHDGETCSTPLILLTDLHARDGNVVWAVQDKGVFDPGDESLSPVFDALDCLLGTKASGACDRMRAEE